jgi:hypothetical protein
MPTAKPYKKPNLTDKVGKDGKLTPEEHKCHLDGNLCLFCGTRSMSAGRERPPMLPITTSPRLERLMPLFHNPPIRVQKNSKQSSVLCMG